MSSFSSFSLYLLLGVCLIGVCSAAAITVDISNYCNNLKEVGITVEQDGGYTIAGEDWILDAGTTVVTIVTPGDYSVSSFSDPDIPSVGFSIPDCGKTFGVGNVTVPDNYCSLGRVIYLNSIPVTYNYYLYKDFETADPYNEIASVTVVANGTVTNQGYYTVPYAAGNYSLVIWYASQPGDSPIARYNFVIPECGSFFGPGVVSTADEYCNNYREIVASNMDAPMSPFPTDPITYYVYDTNFTADPLGNYNTFLSSFSTSQASFTFKLDAGNYTLVVWYPNSNDALKVPIGVYSLVVPADCGTKYGPGGVNLTRYCSNLRQVDLSNLSNKTYFLYRGDFAQASYLAYNDSFTIPSNNHYTLAYAGRFSLVVWSNSNASVGATQSPLAVYPFDVPECGNTYGPGSINATNVCKGNVTITDASTELRYFLYRAQNQTFDYLNPVANATVAEASSVSITGLNVTKNDNYTILAWLNNDISNSATSLPLVRFVFTVPDCNPTTAPTRPPTTFFPVATSAGATLTTVSVLAMVLAILSILF